MERQTPHTKGPQPDLRPSRQYKPPLRLRRLQVAFYTLAALTCAAAGLLFVVRPSHASVLQQMNSARFCEGISVNGVDVSGLTYEQASQRVGALLREQHEAMHVGVRHERQYWAFSAADLKTDTNLDEVLQEAMSLGRSGTVIENSRVRARLKQEGRAFFAMLTPDRETLLAELGDIAALIDTPALEPHAEPDVEAEEPAFVYFEGKEGHVLDCGALADTIQTSLAAGDVTAEFDPVLDLVAPQRTVEQIQAVTVRRAVFQTTFTSSSGRAPGRVRNIQKASGILNGCMVAPGQALSFNEYVGPRTEELGWALAPGIINGKEYEMQAGGGICQVSTTLYNALLCSGPEAEILDRKKHSWPSEYVDYSLDATVSTGGPDLVFQNNSPEPIFLFTYCDAVNYVMTVYVYGAPLPEGVTYQAKGVTEEVLKPKETIVTEEPLWPAGYKKTITKARNGYIATAYREKLVNGQVVGTEKLYTDTYRAVQGEEKVGTGPGTLPIPTT